MLLKLALPERMGGGCLTLANCHLAPSEKGGAMRIQQVCGILQSGKLRAEANWTTLTITDKGNTVQGLPCQEWGVEDAVYRAP